MKNLLIAALLFSATTSAFARAHLIIRNLNAAGVGFNDSTATAPVGGNAGTTLGQQRLNVFQHAADIWGALIDSKLDILIDASFDKLTCDATSGVLGQANPTKFFRDFGNAPQQNVWYPVALANELAGRDLNIGTAQIQAKFNSEIDTPNCLGGIGWYYGFDGKHGAREDLIVTLLHELGHGLGFAGLTKGATGVMSGNFPSVFELHMLDETSGLHFSQMSDAQRIVSATNDQNVVWDGASATAAAQKFLGPTPTLRISAPPSLVKAYQINGAQFGPPLTVGGVNGTVAATVPLDACTALTNAGAIAGRIALIDRGTCNFTVKVKNAQLAGATAVIIADNVPSSLPPLGGADSTITIPAIGISQSDGAAIRAALTSNVTALLFANAALLAGADTAGHLKLYVPAILKDASSMYHWDVSASPNLLMEPFETNDIPPNSVDLTINQLIDIGWKQASPTQGGRYAGRRGH